MKKIKKSLWSAYWKLHDKKKMLVERLKGANLKIIQVFLKTKIIPIEN